MSNNQHNLECGFAEDLVSFLYDEISSAEKTSFERHLINCSGCNEELAAFGYVRSSIINWREDEFSELETPKIEIPAFEKQQIDKEIVSNNSRSWFEGLRQLFSLSPAWATATTAFAALAVISGLTFVLLNFSNNPEIASENPVNKTDKNDSKSVPNTNELEIPDNKVIAKDQPEPKISDEKIPERIVSPNKQETTSLKASIKEVEKSPKIKKTFKVKKPEETYVAGQDGKNLNNNRTTPRLSDVPKLSNLDDDDSDDSLRLADLFDEVGSK